MSRLEDAPAHYIYLIDKGSSRRAASPFEFQFSEIAHLPVTVTSTRRAHNVQRWGILRRLRVSRVGRMKSVPRVAAGLMSTRIFPGTASGFVACIAMLVAALGPDSRSLGWVRRGGGAYGVMGRAGTVLCLSWFIT